MESLASIDEIVSHTQLMSFDLDGLRSDYHVVLATMRSRGSTTFEELTDLLINEENLLKIINSKNTMSAFAVGHQPRGANFQLGRGRHYNNNYNNGFNNFSGPQ